jgi:HK97 gp10 family phage protein
LQKGLEKEMRITFQSNLQNCISEIERKTQIELLKIGEKVTSEAKKRCPVDTGNLRSSVNNQLVASNRVRIGTNVEYAIYVEKGTRRMEAQPFLVPAAYYVLRRRR